MKVLWFVNTPSLAEKVLKERTVLGGWIKSLEKAIQLFNNDITLGVSFYSDEISQPFNIGKTKYYPLASNKYHKLNKKIYKYLVRKIKPESEVNKYITVINDFNPDIIHVHGTEKTFGKIVETTKIPVVISLQGILTVYKHKYFSGMPVNFIRKKQRIRDKIKGDNYFMHYKRFASRSEIEKDILGKCKFLLGRTDWDRRVSSMLAPGAKYFHIDRVLRDEFYKSVWNKKREKEFVIITTMKNSPYKGLESLLHTAKLLKANTRLNFKWMIAGINHKSHVVRLLQSELSHVNDNIKFLDLLTEEYLIYQMLMSDLFIQTSHIENSPNGLAEAMILGLPVIATYAGGTGSYLKDKDEGILVQPGDPWSMAGAIVEIYNDYNKAKEYGQKARQKALIRHNPERIVNELFKTYNLILNLSENI